MRYEVQSMVDRPKLLPGYYVGMCKAQLQDAIELLMAGPDGGSRSLSRERKEQYWQTMEWVFGDGGDDGLFSLSSCLEAIGGCYSVEFFRRDMLDRGLYKTRRVAMEARVAPLPGHTDRCAYLVYKPSYSVCPEGHVFSEVGASMWEDGTKRCLKCSPLGEGRNRRRYASFWEPVFPSGAGTTMETCPKGHVFTPKSGTARTRCLHCHRERTRLYSKLFVSGGANRGNV